MNNFLLSYNALALMPSAGQLLNHVQVNRFIQQYYQPYPGSYVLKSTETAYTLTESFRGLFDNTPFMLSQVFPHLIGGALPSDIWHWINNDALPAIEPTPAGGLVNSMRNLSRMLDDT